MKWNQGSRSLGSFLKVSLLTGFDGRELLNAVKLVLIEASDDERFA